MKAEWIDQIFADTAYVRMGGSDEEKRTAQYLVEACAKLGLQAVIEPFEVDMAKIEHVTLTVDGENIPCKGYLCAGSGEVTAPLYYLKGDDAYSLSLCRGKIVLFDGYLGYWRYRDLLEHGALGFISYDGNVNTPDCDMDQRELRSYVSCGEKIPCVNINVKDAVRLIAKDAKTATISLRQEEWKETSQNVIFDIPGEVEERIVFTAHYDTTSLSQGAYDNMSGCIGLLGIAQYFTQHKPRYSLRFIFCGSEERGLLGSKAYCAAHEEELKNIVLLINLDMIGSIMGHFIACVTAENALVQYLDYFGKEYGFQIKPYQDVYSSDSTPFADKGVPALSFARATTREIAPIHNRYDTAAVMKTAQVQQDIDFITAFAARMATAAFCPVSRQIPDNVKEKLDEYLLRKRKK